jgi:hypothetical protein
MDLACLFSRFETCASMVHVTFLQLNTKIVDIKLVLISNITRMTFLREITLIRALHGRPR